MKRNILSIIFAAAIAALVTGCGTAPIYKPKFRYDNLSSPMLQEIKAKKLCDLKVIFEGDLTPGKMGLQKINAGGNEWVDININRGYVGTFTRAQGKKEFVIPVNKDSVHVLEAQHYRKILGKTVLAGAIEVYFEIDDLDKRSPEIQVVSSKQNHRDWNCAVYISTCTYSPWTRRMYHRNDNMTLLPVHNDHYRKGLPTVNLWKSDTMKRFIKYMTED